MTTLRLTATEVTQRIPGYAAALGALPQSPDGMRKAYGFSDVEDGQCNAIIGTFDRLGNVLFLAAVRIPDGTQADAASKFEEGGMTRMDMLPAIDMIAREREAREQGCGVDDTIPDVDPTQDLPAR
jgi:hypothetical protein